MLIFLSFLLDNSSSHFVIIATKNSILYISYYITMALGFYL